VISLGSFCLFCV